MATIVFASSKGGAGKTTAALTLAFVASHHGTPTTIIDADPNQPIIRWRDRNPDNVPVGLSIISALNDTVMEAIDEASTPLTIVDLEGSKNQDVSVGIGRADLVIIPLTGSRLDADEATSVIRVIKRQEMAFRRSIPFRLMLTRTSPVIEDRHTRDIVQQFRDSSIPILSTRLMERAAFRAPFHTGLNLYQLTDHHVRHAATAIENAEAVAAEIRKTLVSVMNEREFENV
ncbi:MAG: ParA family protein [Proteobacteria bacterium]|nr:ParA family protein [Pseudomonadota bacterium]